MDISRKSLISKMSWEFIKGALQGCRQKFLKVGHNFLSLPTNLNLMKINSEKFQEFERKLGTLRENSEMTYHNLISTKKIPIQKWQRTNATVIE